MGDASQDGICRATASVVSLSGTQSGHLMCDLPASHIARSPGQVAYEAWVATLRTTTPADEPAWPDLYGRAEAWEIVAAAVLASQHHDKQDRITWAHARKESHDGRPE